MTLPDTDYEIIINGKLSHAFAVNKGLKHKEHKKTELETNVII